MIDCGDPTPLENPQYEWVQCYASGELINPLAFGPQPISIVYDTTCGDDCRIAVRLSGYNGAPDVCEGPNFAKPNTVRVNPCAGHYPHQQYFTGYMGWWGYFVDDSNNKRLAAAIDKATEYGGNKAIGVHLSGASYGGTGSLLQSMRLDNITFVRADIPYTLFVQDFPEDSAGLAWEGQDRAVFDFTANADPDIYYRIHGSPLDTGVGFNLDIFDVCNDKCLSCFGTWHAAGHNVWLNGMPLYYLDDYPGPSSQLDVDKPLVAFCNSTANDFGVVGHYNLGLEWNIHTMDGDTIPLRYQPKPEQPTDVTVDVTLRGVSIDEAVVTWTFNTQRGIALNEGGKVYVPGLHMVAAEEYEAIELEGIPGC